MNKLFFVFGPESAGNHITSKILQGMGCYWEEPQKLDAFVSGEKSLQEITTNENIVLRRSVPHGREWTNPLDIKKAFSEYEMITIIPVRDWMPNIFSNYYHRENNMTEALDKLMKAWIHIGKNLIPPFYFFNTSLLFKQPKIAIESLEYFTGLRFDVELYKSIYDADRGKHKLFSKYGFNTLDRGVIREEIA